MVYGDVVSIWNIWFDEDILSGWCCDYLLETPSYNSLVDVFRMKRWILDSVLLEVIEEEYDISFDGLFVGYYSETPDGEKI